MMSGVYVIINLKNGKRYIGSAINFKLRWNSHTHLLRKGSHPNKKLQSSWNKYGADAFEFKILKVVPVDSMVDEEQQFIDKAILLKEKLYNIRNIASSNIGFKHSVESKRKMSEKRRGANNHNYGKPRDPLIIKKMNDARLKKPAYNKGAPMSQEQKIKLSIAKMGIKNGPMSDEQKLKISKSRLGILPWNKHVRYSRLKNRPYQK